ncbi:WD40-repeat-containing domain protein [Leptodontidium sp. MPI-SDFR-AT-0119]|nr:WD40-repeat-containing domain protein [Leptodontidium sp. MPI-SDFR-AT-0119]
MSGAEAVLVIGLIGSLISIIDAAKKIYDTAGDSKGLPEEFRQVAARLPLVIEILRNAEARASKLDKTKLEAIKQTLESCKAKAEKLEKMFEKVIRKDDDKWFDRYKKALRTVGKGDKVECLMEGIHKDTQLLISEKLMGTATEAQVKDDSENRICLQYLRTTDPREDKKRIQDTKGGLLRDSYRWILDNSEFRRWHDDKQSQLLWIRGDPGKGKTMLLCGIIDKLKETPSVASASGCCLLSYFFCQATDLRINSATAVLRGLIYLLADQQPALLQHVRKKYDATGKELFVGTNAWFALSEIFINILQDPSLERTYVIIDALDECVTGLQQLLQFIDETSTFCPRVKWIISSRNWPSIEELLRISDQKIQLRLELNQDSISTAVSTYIEHKVGKLAKRKNYNAKLENSVREYLSLNADATFLWVALVLKELEAIERRIALERVKMFPPGLGPLYEQMMAQVSESNSADLCKRILSIVAVVKRPVTLTELVSLDDTLHKLNCPEDLSEDIEDLEQTVGQCGSFLTIRESTVYFVHQSAKDFLFPENTSQELCSSKIDEINHAIFTQSLQVMSRALRRDVYRLKAPGITIDQVKRPDPDPLATVRYSCLYWVDHLLECQMREDIIKDLKDSGPLYSFLRQYFLYWLEALSLLKSVSEGVIMIKKLEDLLVDGSTELQAFIHDARRFAVSNRSIIEQAPLQTYCSALVFAPEKSIVRETFGSCIPPWIQRKPRVETYWNAMLQTLEGHTNGVTSVAFSPDGKQIVSGSWDKTVRRWDAATGQQLLPALKGHTSWVTSVAFSPDGKQIVSGSDDKTVRRWDAATGQQLLLVLKGHTSWVTSVAFSPDGKQIVSGSEDQTVRRWDAATGQQLLPALEGHTSEVTSVAFSPDGKQIVSGSWDKTVRRWDAATGQQLLPALEGHTSEVTSVAFSPDGKQIVSGSEDQTVRRWDAATGQQLLPALEGHTRGVTSVAFSPDGKQIVSGSSDQTVRRWDATTGQQLLPALEGHTRGVTSVAFSPDGKQIVSGSSDQTVRRWDAATGQQLLPALEGHTSEVTSVAFSPDGKQIVSGSSDQTVRLWDAATGQQLLPALEGHTREVTSVAFSPDGKQIVSGSEDQTVRRWDAATGQQLLPALEGHTREVTSVAFSPDGKQIVSGSDDQTARLWDAATGQQLLPALKGHTSWVTSVAFSPDGKQIVSGSWDQTARRWDAATGQQLLPALKGHTSWVTSVAFSPDGKQIVSGSSDQTVRRWDAATGQQLLPALKGHTSWVTSVASSPDGKHFPTLHVSEYWLTDGTSKLLWLPTGYRPTCEAVCDRTIVLGHSTGRLSFLQIQKGLKQVI